MTNTQIAELASMTGENPAELWRASQERRNPFTNGKRTGLTSLMIGLVVVSLTYATEPISTTTAKASAELSAMLMAMPDAKNDCMTIVAVLQVGRQANGPAGPGRADHYCDSRRSDRQKVQARPMPTLGPPDLRTRGLARLAAPATLS